jgi:hypothetical protein
MRTIAIVLVLAAATAGAATAATLPGVKTPTRNISCFWVPIKKRVTSRITPATRGNLLCDVKHASYLRAEQTGCQARAGLDWHGFELPWNRRAQPVCSGGILYDAGHDRPVFKVLPYGRSWRYRGFTCTSRLTGLACMNRLGHGLFLSRESRRLY